MLSWCFVCQEAFGRCVVDVEIGTTPLAMSARVTPQQGINDIIGQCSGRSSFAISRLANKLSKAAQPTNVHHRRLPPPVAHRRGPLRVRQPPTSSQHPLRQPPPALWEEGGRMRGREIGLR